MVKELKVLIQQLRNYPSNLFIVPVVLQDDKHNPPHAPVYGLSIVNVQGEEQGFINTGDTGGVTVG
jgi:hypothetical protein